MGGILTALIGSFAPAAGAYESIASATGSGQTITFSSIPSTYRHLQLRCNLLSSDGAQPIIRLNGDTASNYAYHLLYGNGSSTAASGSSSRTFIGAAVGGLDSTAPYTLILDIQNYNSTSQNKTVRMFLGMDTNGGGWVALYSGLWINTSAVNSLTVDAQSPTTFSASSSFALYGIKGA